MPKNDTGAAARTLHEALTLENTGRREEALRAAERALELFGAAGDRTGCAAAHHLLFALKSGRGDLEAADAHLVSALSLREDTGDREGVASLHQQRFALAVRRGDGAAAREASEALLAACVDIGDREGHASAIHQFVQFLLHEGDLARARELVEQGMWLTDRAGEERGRSALTLLAGQIDMGEGNLERALRRTQEAAALAQRARKRPALVEAQNQLGVMFAACGRLGEAREALEAALDGRELLRDLEGRAATLRELAGVEQALGMTDEALGRLDYAARTWAELGNPGAQATALHVACTLADEADRSERALALGERLVGACEALGDAEAAGSAWFAQGTRRAQRGELDEAASAYRRASERQAAALCWEPYAVSLGMLGQVLAALGRQEEALQTLATARARLAALGSENLAMLDEIIGAVRGG